ncbi:seryl-tRNA synthetase N-terminal domain protein, partial [Streptococcus pyogenes SS1447]
MLDLKRIRTDFDTVAAKLKNRGVSEDTLTHLKELDEKRRTLLVQSEELKAERNIASAAIAQAKRQKEDATQQIADMQKVSADIKTIDNQLVAIDQQVTDIITVLPNTPHDSV